MKVFLYYIGKPRDAHANAMAAEYMKRTERYARCAMREIHPARFDLWSRHAAATKVLLDPEGRTLDSFKFAEFIAKAEQESRDVVFTIGGASGYPLGWREKADALLSLSAMTFAHELTRVMLSEQIYRAFTVLRGHPYSK